MTIVVKEITIGSDESLLKDVKPLDAGLFEFKSEGNKVEVIAKSSGDVVLILKLFS